jgi:LysR family glycine cleavage system transcriptional activator
MCRRMLPLNALRCFEAAARHGSLAKAAEELNVTPSAVHYQVKSLEAQLGVRLFRREGRTIALTEAALAALPSLEAALDLMTLAYEQLRRFDTQGILRISVCPSFAARWLVARFDSFRTAFPNIEVRISVSERLVDFSAEEEELAIHYGDGIYPGLRAECLGEEEVFPVCSPKLVEGSRPLTTPKSLRHHVLLHDDSAREDRSCPDWAAWLRAAGVRDVAAGKGPRFNSPGLVLDAAVAGRGVALARRSLAMDDLAAGRLVQPFQLSMPVAYAYWVVSPEELADHPKVTAFREWLFAEASLGRAQADVDPAAAKQSAMLPKRERAYH